MKKYILIIAALTVVGIWAGVQSCKKSIKGCTDHKAWNYIVDATIDDGSCIYDEWEELPGDTVWGCTDSTADNFNPEATHDDGSCIWYGCMDPKADNYNPQANVDDGSCIDPRVKFAGTYNVSDDCGFIFGLEPNPDLVYDTTVVDTLFIDPFFALGGTAFAFVDSTAINVPLQTIGIIEFSGTGSINPTLDVVTISYSWDAGFTTGVCTAVYNKQ